jgi:hypothetical protein
MTTDSGTREPARSGPSESSPPEPAWLTRLLPNNRFLACVLFLFLVFVYQANGSVLDEGDCVPTINLSLAILETGRLSFDPDHFPEMFKWKSKEPFEIRDDFYFVGWDDHYLERNAREWASDGNIEFNGPRYYMVESPTQHQYVSTFGPIPAFFLVPVMGPFYAFDHKIAWKHPLKTSIAKLDASMLVAATAVLLFFIALRYLSRTRALIVALIYGLATIAWAVSSQNMWQQTVNQFLLTVGAFFFLGSVEKRHVAALSGLAFGAAVACRATGAIFYAAVVVYLFVHERKSVVPFLVGSLPVPILIAIYNAHYFGSPLSFAQELVGHTIAKEKTGSPKLWQTPIYEGATGLLFSPSRGLVIFSPILIPAFWGAYRVFQERRFGPFRPLTLAALATMALQCRWFDWWGGWTYGYRPWIDVVPYLVLLMIPMLERMLVTRLRQAAFAAAFAWSAFVEALGAYSYDRSWNIRTLYVVRFPQEPKPVGLFDEDQARKVAELGNGVYLGPSRCDIDLVYCRHRLWSFRDSIIMYQYRLFGEARSRRLPPGWDLLERSSEIAIR